MKRYPNHDCACDDTDLSLAQAIGDWRDGSKVLITCGKGHRRAISRALWETELERRYQVFRATDPLTH